MVMKYCLDIKRNPKFRKLEIASLLAIEFIAFLMFIKNDHSWGRLLTICYLGICLLTWVDSYILTRKYYVDPTGLTVSLTFGYNKKFKWEQIAQVAVCRVHMKARSHKEMLAIRFSICANTIIPQNAVYANEKWSSELYELLHWKNVISVEYSDARYEDIAKYCTSQILDCRHLKADYE